MSQNQKSPPGAKMTSSRAPAVRTSSIRSRFYLDAMAATTAHRRRRGGVAKAIEAGKGRRQRWPPPRRRKPTPSQAEAVQRTISQGAPPSGKFISPNLRWSSPSPAATPWRAAAPRPDPEGNLASSGRWRSSTTVGAQVPPPRPMHMWIPPGHHPCDRDKARTIRIPVHMVDTLHAVRRVGRTCSSRLGRSRPSTRSPWRPA